MLNKFTKDGVFLRKKNELFNHIQYNTKETDQIWFLVVKKSVYCFSKSSLCLCSNT